VLAGALSRISARTWLFASGAAAALLAAFGLWRWLSEAVLMVDLPAAERHGVVLTVNDAPQTVGEPGLLHIAGRPGKWAVRVTRPGYIPIVESFRLASGEYRQWSPVWKPTEKLERSNHLAALQKRSEAEAHSDPDAESLKVLLEDLIAFRAQSEGTGEGAAA